MKQHLYCPLLLIGSYLVGSVSSAILVTWLWTRKDIRLLGNRNAGAANVARSVGLLPAVCVALVDFSKGALPVITSRWLGFSDGCALAGGTLAVIGHSYPLYFRFRGGKGLAASIGALLVLTPFETLLVLPILGLVYLVITGSAVTGALVALGLLIGLNFWRGYPPLLALAPLAFLATMGVCTIPEILYHWTRRADKGTLLMHWMAPHEMPLTKQRVAVITDSIASLPVDLSKQEKVIVVPLTLILPEGIYRDGVDIDSRQYYRLLREEKLLPKTSAPSPGEYLALYKQLGKQYEAGLVITPPKELTQTWNSARVADEMNTDSFSVQVIDSRVAGPAQGFVALAAAGLAANGANLDDIVRAIEIIRHNTGFIGVLDTLKFLIEGGRVYEARQWIKTALRLFPVISLISGQIRVIGMARTKTKAVNRMVNYLVGNLPKENLAMAICHTDAFEEAAALEKRLQAIFDLSQSFVTELTPVIGAHTGAGFLGVAWWIQSNVE